MGYYGLIEYLLFVFAVFAAIGWEWYTLRRDMAARRERGARSPD